MRQNHRNNDPPTSTLAGDQIESDDTAQHHRAMCLEAVRRSPGMTAREIEAQLGVKAHTRLPELRKNGLVANGRDRTCKISGRRAMTWHPRIPTNPSGDPE